MNDRGGDVAVDSSTNGINLPLINSPSWVSDWLALDGTTQYGDAGSNILNCLDTNDVTICAWINYSGNSQEGVVVKGYWLATNNLGGWAFTIENGQLKWQVEGGNSFTDNGHGVVPINQWTFVTFTWSNSTQVATFYINGQLTSAPGGDGNSPNGEVPSGIGHLEVGDYSNPGYPPANLFEGSMHDVGLYNRVLSAAEVESNYLNTVATTNVPYPDLVYYEMTNYPADYDFTLFDNSTHGNTPGYAMGTNWVWTNNVAFIPNTALHFHGEVGQDNYIDTGTQQLFNFTTNSFTINLWFRPYQGGAFVMGNDTYSTCGWYLRLVGPKTTKIQFSAETSNSDNSIQTVNGVGNWPYQPTVDYATEKWHMLTVTRDGTNTPLILIDGQVWATTGTIPNPTSSTNDLTIGTGQEFEGTAFLDGDIWMVQIWGEALPATLVYILYTNQLSGNSWPITLLSQH